MNEAFGENTEESRRLLLVQAEQAAMAALEQYDMEEEQIHFIQISDHITYHIVSRAKTRYSLRIHPETSSREQIQSELIWLDSLDKEHGLIVPTGVTNCHGSRITEVETDKGRRWPVTILRWVDGDHCEDGLSDGQVYRMGALMARLHQASQAFVPPVGFTRPTWGKESFKRDFERLEQHYRSFLSVEELQLYIEAAKKIQAHLDRLERSSSQFGMIHADLHEGNLVFQAEQPFPIDFGRCGFGHYLYDMAQAFIGLYPPQRQLFIDGYESIRLLNRDSMDVLETFFIQALIENQSFHAPNPLEWAELKGQKPYSLSLIRHYLNDVPFLFARTSV